MKLAFNFGFNGSHTVWLSNYESDGDLRNDACLSSPDHEEVIFFDFDRVPNRKEARRLAAALSHWADTGELVDPVEAPAPAPPQPAGPETDRMAGLEQQVAHLIAELGELEADMNTRAEKVVQLGQDVRYLTARMAYLEAPDPAPPQPSPGGVMSGLAERVEKLENFVANLGLDARLVTSMCGGIGETKDRLAVLEGDVAALRAELAGKVSFDEADRLASRLEYLERPSVIWPRLASLEDHAALRWVMEKGRHETVDLAEPEPAGPSDAEPAGDGFPDEAEMARWELDMKIVEAARAWAGSCEWDGELLNRLLALCREPAP